MRIALTREHSQTQRLPDAFRRDAESFFGIDLANVHVRIDPVARRFGARAFAFGDEVVFHPGQYNPETDSGRELLIHELTHVAQQRRGANASRPFTVDDACLEAQANEAARRFLRGEPAPAIHARRPGIQRQTWGAVGTAWINTPPHEYTKAKADQASWEDAKDVRESAKTTEYRGVFGLLNPTYDGKKQLSQVLAARGAGWVPLPDTFTLAKYHSTASENEIYDTRANAWNRVIAIVTALGAIGFTGNNPSFVYYVTPAAGRQVPDILAQNLIADATRVIGQNQIIFVRYKAGNTPGAAGQGIYYDFGATTIGANKLLIAEHTQDEEAYLWTYRASKNAGYALAEEARQNKVRHFHIVGYPQANNSYLPIATGDTAFNREVRQQGNLVSRIRESELLTEREGYVDLAGMPGHHIYYLAR
jgi:hypothetical protein